jgi:hypothetical protein
MASSCSRHDIFLFPATFVSRVPAEQVLIFQDLSCYRRFKMRVLFNPGYNGSPASQSKYQNRSGMPLDTFDHLDGLVSDNHWVTHNNGNMIHAEASSKIFLCNRSRSAVGGLPRFSGIEGADEIETMVASVSKEFDAIVLNFANIIHRKGRLAEKVFLTLESGFGSIATFIENLKDVQIFAYGVGLQGDMEADKSLIGPQLYRLLAALNKKAVVFGTRGAATAKFLNDLGFDNAKALGCPSMYINPSATANLKSNPIKENSRVTSAGHLNSYGLSSGRVQPLLEIAKAYDTDYAFQDDLYKLFPSERLSEIRYNSESHEVEKLAAEKFILEGLKRPSAFSRYYYFRSPQAWRAFSATRDIYIGDRFHGGVTFLQVGLPAGFIYYDARVLELTSFYGLQAFKPQQVLDMGPQETLRVITSQEAMAKFKDTYSDRIAAFSKSSKEAG